MTMTHITEKLADALRILVGRGHSPDTWARSIAAAVSAIAEYDTMRAAEAQTGPLPQVAVPPPTQWGRPSCAGAYWCKGWSCDTAERMALVRVEWRGPLLVCDLRECNSDHPDEVCWKTIDADMHPAIVFSGPLSAPAPRSGDAMDIASFRDMVEGMSVSVDVSTDDDTASNRYFGTVSEAMEDPDSKHGMILLVQDAEPNFDLQAPAPVEVTDEMVERACVQLYGAENWPLYTVGAKTASRESVRAALTAALTQVAK